MPDSPQGVKAGLLREHQVAMVGRFSAIQTAEKASRADASFSRSGVIGGRAVSPCTRDGGGSASPFAGQPKAAVPT